MINDFNKQEAVNFILNYEKSTDHLLLTIRLRLENWYYFLSRSFEEVIRAIEIFEKTGEYNYKEFYRFIFNYLNSETSLTNKIMGWRNHLLKENIQIISEKEYSEKLESFGVLIHKEFIKDLRNNYTHEAKGENFGISFNSILDNGKRISSRIEFIFLNDNNDLEIYDLKEIVVSHTSAVLNFYEWFLKEINKGIEGQNYKKYLDCLQIVK